MTRQVADDADSAATKDSAAPQDSAPGRRMSTTLGIAALRAVSVLAGLGYVKFYTNALSVEQVGEFFYLGTLSYVLNALVFVPIDAYMQARLSRLHALPLKALGRLIGAALLAGLGLCLALAVPLVLTNLLRVSDAPLLYAMAALLYLCSSLRNLLNIRGHAVFAAGMLLMESVARLLAFVAMAALLGASAQMLVLSTIAALAAELLVLVWQARRVLPSSASSEPLDAARHIVRTSLTLAGSAASNTAQLQGYRVMFPAAGFAGTAATLSVAANIGAVGMSACAQIFSQLFIPRLYQGNGASIGWYVKWASAMALAVMVIGMTLAEPLVRLLTKELYVPYASAIGVGIVIEAGNMLIGAYTVYLTLHGRTAVLFWFQFAGAIISLTGCLLLLFLLPKSPLLLGMVVAGSQLIITPLLALYVYRLQRR